MTPLWLAAIATASALWGALLAWLLLPHTARRQRLLMALGTAAVLCGGGVLIWYAGPCPTLPCA